MSEPTTFENHDEDAYYRQGYSDGVASQQADAEYWRSMYVALTAQLADARAEIERLTGRVNELDQTADDYWKRSRMFEAQAAKLSAVVEAAREVWGQWRGSLGWDRKDTFKKLGAALAALDEK